LLWIWKSFSSSTDFRRNRKCACQLFHLSAARIRVAHTQPCVRVTCYFVGDGRYYMRDRLVCLAIPGFFQQRSSDHCKYTSGIFRAELGNLKLIWIVRIPVCYSNGDHRTDPNRYRDLGLSAPWTNRHPIVHTTWRDLCSCSHGRKIYLGPHAVHGKNCARYATDEILLKTINSNFRRYKKGLKDPQIIEERWHYRQLI